VREPKCASRQKTSNSVGVVFVICSQVIESHQQNLPRYDESASGRFVGGFNTYAYVKGNPLSLTDPSGLIDLTINVCVGFTFFNQALNLGGAQGFNMSAGFQLNLGTFEGTFYSSFTQLNGYGSFVGGGFQFGGGASKECSTPRGKSQDKFATWESGLGYGPSYEGQIQANNNGGQFSTSVGRIGGGFGVYSATGQGTQSNFTFGGFPRDCSCSK
jgi:hypothetical protein